MSSTTITSKGQITLPKPVRDQLGLEAGDRVDFVLGANGTYSLIPIKRSVAALKGFITKPAKPVSLEKMTEVVRKRAAGGSLRSLKGGARK